MLGGGLVCHPRLRSSYSLFTLPWELHRCCPGTPAYAYTTATAIAYSVTKCGDTLLDRGGPQCHHEMRARWLATEGRQVTGKLWAVVGELDNRRYHT